MLELVTVRTGKFVENIKKKKRNALFEVVHQTFVNSSVKNISIRFVTVRRIPKKKCVYQFKIFVG